MAVHDGWILEILPTPEASAEYQSHLTLHLSEHALIPGLINTHTHTHAVMPLFCGLAADLPLGAYCAGLKGYVRCWMGSTARSTYRWEIIGKNGTGRGSAEFLYYIFLRPSC